MADKTYRGTCIRACYWKETLWLPGEVYEGDTPPNHHFSVDGKVNPELPPPDAGSDVRSTKEIKRLLKVKYSTSKPASWTRKKLWAALNELETAEEKDEATNPSDGVKRPGRPKANHA